MFWLGRPIYSGSCKQVAWPHDHNVHAVTPFAPCFREYGTVAKPSNAFGWSCLLEVRNALTHLFLVLQQIFVHCLFLESRPSFVKVALEWDESSQKLRLRRGIIAVDGVMPVLVPWMQKDHAVLQSNGNVEMFISNLPAVTSRFWHLFGSVLWSGLIWSMIFESMSMVVCLLVICWLMNYRSLVVCVRV